MKEEHTTPVPSFSDAISRVARAKALVDQLNAYNIEKNQRLFHARNGKSFAAYLTPDEFTRTTTGIHFYDGMVVLDKGEHRPYNDVQRGGVTVNHDIALEQQRPSELQVKRSRHAAAT